MIPRPTSSRVNACGSAYAVEDARAFLARLDEADPPQRREMLRRPAGVEVERILESADGVLAVLQQLEDPHPRRVPERAEHASPW